MIRGVEWSLRNICEHASGEFIFASTRAVIYFLMRVASTLENTNGQQRALLKFSAKHVQYTQTESIRQGHFTIRHDSHVTSRLDLHRVASRKSTSDMTNRQQGKRFVSIRSNRLESTKFSTHPQSPDQLYFLSLAQIDFRHLESTEGETIRVDSME